MPRIRTIKPEFATDEKLARVSRDARLTFVLCITQSDDDGLLAGNDRQLLAALYPLDNSVTYASLAGMIEELVDIGLLRWRETKDGSPIVQIVNWSNHQKVDHKGKSLLLPHLKPEGEETPRVSRVSREEVATVSRSDLGPRTMDHGPRTIAPDGARRPRRARPAGEPAPSWVTDGVDLWAGIVGAVAPGEFGKALKPMIVLHGWPAVRPDLEKWLRARLASGKPCKPAWYAGEVTARLAPKPAIVNEHGELTEYGERITRPDKVPA
jgi:hypothetical protein